MFTVGGGGEPEVVMKAMQQAKNGDIIQMHIRTQDYHSSVAVYPWLKENHWELVTISSLYDQLLLEGVNSDGCDLDVGMSLTRTCLD